MSDDQWTRSVWLEQYGVDAWERMSTIREIESRLAEYTKRGYIRGSSHPAIGMEAVAVGVSLNLRQTDAIASTHRGHAHCLAKGADPQRLLAELFGRATGASRPRALPCEGCRPAATPRRTLWSSHRLLPWERRFDAPWRTRARHPGN